MSGTAPNRIFNIEWRAVYFAAPTNTANFELRLYESQDRFDVIYGSVANGNTSATAGMQSIDTCFAQYLLQRLGWSAYGRLDERSSRYANANADTNCHGDGYRNRHCYGYAYCYRYRDSHSNGHSDSHGNAYAYAHADSKTYTYTKV